MVRPKLKTKNSTLKTSSSKVQAALPTFHVEKPLLAINSSRITCEVATRTDHTVARDDDCDRVSSVCETDCPHGIGITEPTRNFAVGICGTEWDPSHFVPHFVLEFGAVGLDREFETVSLAPEVLLELPQSSRASTVDRVRSQHQIFDE
jgi:hypothetical protein